MLLRDSMAVVILVSGAWLTPMAYAAPLTFNVDGVITDNSNQPLEAPLVSFTIEIKNPAASCTLYREVISQVMTGSNGYFSIVLGTGANAIAGGVNLEKVFSNHGTAIPGEFACSYTPTTTDTRKIAISFDDGYGPQAFNIQDIQSVPFALQAQAINGYGAGLLLKVAPWVSQTLNNNSELTQAQYDEFWRLVKNPSTLLGQALPGTAPTSGQALVSNGTSWVLQSLGAGSVTSVSATAPLTVTGTAAAPIINIPAANTTTNGYLTSADWNTFNSKIGISLASGSIWVGNGSNLATAVGMSGDATMANTGAVTLKNTGTAGTYFKITTDAQGRVTSGSNLASGDITTALGYTPVNKAGDTMGGALSMGGFDIGNTGNISMTANKYFGLSANTTPGTIAGQVWYDSGLIKYYDGSVVKTLGVAGAGITSLNGLTSGTQTFAIGTSGLAPAFTSATSTHTLNIPMASTASVTAGLISKADYDSFNTKLGTTLTGGKVWVGNASNVATEQTLSGDITAVSNTGAVTVDKTQAAAASKILQLTAGSVAVTKGEDIGGAGTGVASIRYPNTTVSTILTLPNTAGSASQFLQTDGAGNLSWAAPAASLPGLNNSLMWLGNASNVATAVSMSGDATISNAGVLTANKTTTGQSNKLLSLDGTGTATSYANQLMGSVTGSLALLPAASTTNYSLTFPAVQGSAGQTLSNNGAGVLSWASAMTTALNSGNILVGNASNIATSVAMSGDATMASTGAVTLKNTGTAGTYSKVTTDAQGRVTSGANPSTLSGYGITDAVVNAGGVPSLSSGTLAARPAFGTAGRVYFATDTKQEFIDTGVAWDQLNTNASDLVSGFLAAARLPALTGDVTSTAGSNSISLNTVPLTKGGTGLTALGTANQVLGMNNAATGMEYKTITAGTGVTITHGANSVTIAATGSGGTVTNVTSANTDIAVASSSTTPVLTLNSGTAGGVGDAAKIAKLDASGMLVPAMIPSIDTSKLTSGVLPISRGGTNSSTTLIGNRIMASTASTIVEAAAITANKALISDVNGIPTHSVVTSTELSYLSGVTSAVQTQINSKASSAGWTNYSAMGVNGSGNLIAVPGASSGSIFSWSVTGPIWTTASFPTSTSANELLYSSANNVVGGLATANSAVLTTSGLGVPSWSPLTTDNFSQYALLAGRAGGQTLNGGTAASENLTLDSTSNATKGNIILAAGGGKVGIGTTSPGYLLEVGLSTGTAIAAKFINNGGGLSPTAIFTNSNAAGFAAKFANTGGGISAAFQGEIQPAVDNTDSLGDATHRFTAVYATNGTIQTSDERQKKDIEDSDLGLDFITKLRPVSYYWKTGADTGLHYGLIAQETEKILSEVKKQAPNPNEAIVVHDEKTDQYGIKYSELISPLIKAVQEFYKAFAATQIETQKLQAENSQLKTRLDKSEKETAAIKTYLCKKDPGAIFCSPGQL